MYTSRGQVEGEDWAAVAAAVNERMAARRVGQQELSQLSGVSVSTLRQVQHGAGRRVQNRTLTAIAHALGWPEDHLTTVLLTNAGSSTVPVDTAEDVLTALRRVEVQLQEMAQQLAELTAAVRVGDTADRRARESRS